MLIVLLAFAILILFYNNSEAIMQSNKFYLFMTLVTVGMGLMLGLMFLVSNSKHPSHKKYNSLPKLATHKAVASKKTSKKKK